VPAVLRRFVPLPYREGHQFMRLELIIRRFLQKLFSGMEVIDCHVFRITRDSDFDLDDYEEINDLIEVIERQIRERRRGAATRLEIEGTLRRNSSSTCATPWTSKSRTSTRSPACST
jgi:polyphosphate kinase